MAIPFECFFESQRWKPTSQQIIAPMFFVKNVASNKLLDVSAPLWTPRSQDKLSAAAPPDVHCCTKLSQVANCFRRWDYVFKYSV